MSESIDTAGRLAEDEAEKTREILHKILIPLRELALKKGINIAVNDQKFGVNTYLSIRPLEGSLSQLSDIALAIVRSVNQELKDARSEYMVFAAYPKKDDADQEIMTIALRDVRNE
jgi:hypothetical protein